ncbi:MAG: hypothetical protein PHH82_02255 [Candidatus ainarchaeum sp.]|nr:hypothetical protein [Candidatus ainarchaeum sp.]
MVKKDANAALVVVYYPDTTFTNSCERDLKFVDKTTWTDQEKEQAKRLVIAHYEKLKKVQALLMGALRKKLGPKLFVSENWISAEAISELRAQGIGKHTKLIAFGEQEDVCVRENAKQIEFDLGLRNRNVHYDRQRTNKGIPDVCKAHIRRI